MRKRFNKLCTTCLTASLLMTQLVVGQPVFASQDAEEEVIDKIQLDEGILVTTSSQLSIASQVTMHVTTTPHESVNFTWTTKEEVDSKITVIDEASGEVRIYTVEPVTGNSYNEGKYFHRLTVDGLTPNTRYHYIINTGEDDSDTVKGSFKTADHPDEKQSVKFAYIADTQIRGDGFNPTDVKSSDEAKALGVLFNQLLQYDDLDFTYIAGDITDTAINESQWEAIFENDGPFKTAGADFFKNNIIAVTEGNHDMSSFHGHLNVPEEAGKVVYSFDYGMIKFIILNLEKDMPADRKVQEAFLREEVAKAKEEGQWTLVGFHKSIYTGASHIMDSDVISARKYWGPILSGLDVDMVLQGHDHVYARGFINSQGYNANPTVDEDQVILRPSYAPLYMVGGHAGTLKWYGKQEDYTISLEDPISPNYEFLDVNSNDFEIENPQTYIIVEIDETTVSAETYMFNYNAETEQMENFHLADTFTFRRLEREASLTVGNVVAARGQEVSVPVSLAQVDGLKELSATIGYQSDLLNFEQVVVAEGLEAQIQAQVQGNEVQLVVALDEEMMIDEAQVIAYLVFTVDEAVAKEQVTTLAIRKARIENAAQNSLQEVLTYDGSVEILYYQLGDVNQDGTVDGLDALKLMQHLQGLFPLGDMIAYADVNQDGSVDEEDVQHILEMSVR